MTGGRAQLLVLELCEGIAGPLCGRHLAMLGASVERVEPSGSDRARAWGLHAPGALHALLADGKRAGRDGTHGRAAVVLADEGTFDPGALEPAEESPRLLVLFEREGLDDGATPGTDTTVQALLGLMDYVGDRWNGPARTGADIASVCTAICGVHAVLAWLLGPQTSGWQTVRVSPLRTLAALKTVIWAARARPDAWTGSHVVARDRHADSGYRVRDGWVTIDFPHDRREAWSAFCRELGLAELVERAGERWWETVGWGDDVDAARPVFEAALDNLSREEASELVRRHGGSSVPFNAPREVLAHAQARELGISVGKLPWRVLHGATEQHLAAPEYGGAGRPPLAGTRVADFGVGGVGPFAGSLLATLGADVIKIEAPNEFIHAVRPASDGLSTTYSALNAGKRSADLNLKDPEDSARALALVREADVLLENFRPGAMDRLGFGYAALADMNPGLVYVSAQGFGSSGPLAQLQCTDPHIQAFAGWALANADRSGAPRRTRYYAMLDLATALVIVEATLAALVQRAGAGSGSHVEISMLEAVAGVHVSRWAGIEAQDGGWSCERLFAPDAIFATADGAIALSVEDDLQWSALVRALGNPDTLAVPAWRTNAGRLAAERELDGALGAILAQRSSQGWLVTLAGCGVSVARVTGDDDAVLRRDLWARDYLRALPREGREPLRAGGPPWAFEPPLPTLSSPQPGRDEPCFTTQPTPVGA